MPKSSTEYIYRRRIIKTLSGLAGWLREIQNGFHLPGSIEATFTVKLMDLLWFKLKSHLLDESILKGSGFTKYARTHDGYYVWLIPWQKSPNTFTATIQIFQTYVVKKTKSWTQSFSPPVLMKASNSFSRDAPFSLYCLKMSLGTLIFPEARAGSHWRLNLPW